MKKKKTFHDKILDLIKKEFGDDRAFVFCIDHDPYNRIPIVGINGNTAQISALIGEIQFYYFKKRIEHDQQKS